MKIKRSRVQRQVVNYLVVLLTLSLSPGSFPAQELTKVEKVELQPLIAQVKRLVEAMDYLGVPISDPDKQALDRAIRKTDPTQTIAEIQDVLDKYCLAEVFINPESRVKVAQGPAKPELVEQGWRSFLLKVRNEAGVTAQLKAESPQAELVYTRSTFSPNPRETVHQSHVANRWPEICPSNRPPAKPALSGPEPE